MTEASSGTSLALTIDKHFLECSICFRPFVDPRGLPCLHPFCCECLENWAKACSKDGTILNCPLCKKVYQIPEEEGVKGFPGHFLVGYLQNTANQKPADSSLCVNHGKKKEYFCERCDSAVCSDCAVLDPSHEGHRFIQLKEASQRQSRSLENLAGRVRKVEEKYENAIKMVKQVKGDLERGADAKKVAINDARDEFLQQVENIVGALKKNVDHQKELNLNQIQETLENLQVELTTVRNSCELATNIVESGSDSDIVSLYPSLSATLQQLAESEPCAVETALGIIKLELINHTRSDLQTLKQLLCGKLHIKTASLENSQANKQTAKHVSAQASVGSLSQPTATPLSSTAAEPETSTEHLSAIPAKGTSAAARATPSPNISPAVNKPIESHDFPKSNLAAQANSKYGKSLAEHQSATPAKGTSAATRTTPSPNISPAINKPTEFQDIPKSNLAAQANSKYARSVSAQETKQDTTKNISKPKASGFSFFFWFTAPDNQPAPTKPPRKEWKECGKIKTAPIAKYPRCIARLPNQDIAVSSFCAPVTVFSRNGVVKHAIGSSTGIKDFVVTPSNQYIIPSELGRNEFYIYDSEGILLHTTPTYDINDKPSTPRSVAVDSTGRIIVGLGWDDHKTISIHQPDGTLISKFQTLSRPRILTCAPDDRLVILFGDKTLQVMDQSGRKVSTIQPPPGIQSWNPRNICCGGRKLYVNNRGVLSAIFRYVYTGDEFNYQDCIGVERDPYKMYGITLSADKKELFVVERASSLVHIFREN